jgi:uncharacterized protein (DUF427 family)
MRMRATCNGATIAQSDETILVEGNHYFPPESVDSTFLRRSRMKSLCPWKGVASYHHVQVAGERSANAAWSYRHPYPWIRKIKNRVAFWNGVDVVLD